MREKTSLFQGNKIQNDDDLSVTDSHVAGYATPYMKAVGLGGPDHLLENVAGSRRHDSKTQ